MRGVTRAAVNAVLRARGSTRALGLMRMGVVMILWTRFAIPLAPMEFHDDAGQLATSFVFYVSSWLVFAGLWTRATSVVLAAVVTLIRLYYGHHLGLAVPTGPHPWLVVVLMALVPTGGSFSVDGWLLVRKARKEGRPPPPERGDLWGTWSFVVALSTIYWFAAYDKLNAGWFAGARIERLWISQYGASDDLARYPIIHVVSVAIAYLTVIVELALAFGIWFRRTRPVVLLLGLVMHLCMWFVLAVWPFTPMVLLSYLAVIDPDRFHRLLDDTMGPAGTES